MAARSLEAIEQLLGCAEAVSTGLVEAVMRMVLRRQLVGSSRTEEGRREEKGGVRGEGIEGVMNGVSGLLVYTQTLIPVTS